MPSGLFRHWVGRLDDYDGSRREEDGSDSPVSPEGYGGKGRC